MVPNGGGTTHKPKWVSPAGYAVPEAALMARVLQEEGVDPHDIYLEGYSDDTIGNAYFVRAVHADPSQCSTWIATAPRLAISLMNALFTWRQPVMLCEKTAVGQPPAGAGSAGAPTAPRTRS